MLQKQSAMLTDDVRRSKELDMAAASATMSAW
jgi:hypothetical protein